jgi:hypothetical protein
MVVAVLVGLYVWRRPQDPVRILWLATVVLALRCVFESVMTPYYLAPPLFLALVLASRQGSKRFWAAAIVAMESTVFAYHHLSPWAWWLPVVAGVATVVALSYPTPVPPADPTVDAVLASTVSCEDSRDSDERDSRHRELEPAL